MKQPKKLTYSQKVIVSNNGLMTDDWMFVKETDYYLTVINKHDGKQKIIDKYNKRKQRGINALVGIHANRNNSHKLCFYILHFNIKNQKNQYL